MVRATFAGFSTALSAIQANQKRLDVIGHNLANMNTVGYTRQQLETSSLNYTSPVSNYMNGSEIIVGFGTRMDRVSQIRDPYLDIQYRTQMQKSSYTDALQTSLDSLAKIFDESDIQGIQNAFNDIYSSLINMQDSSKVNDAIYESELRTRIQHLTNLLNESDRQITEAQQQEFQRLDGTNTTENGAIQEVNDILRQIGNLNRRIKENQILGQQSLELMDERNVLLDTLSSYIPIEVTYYKDQAHDGVDVNGNEDLSETYHLDSNGKPMFKKEWPDDLRVEMLYYDEQGNTQRLTLVEGTEGTGAQNYGKLTLNNGNIMDPANFTLTITGSEANLADPKAQESITLNPNIVNGAVAGIAPGTADNGTTVAQLTGGSIQASLDMLWKSGNTELVPNKEVKGYQYYREQLDNLANSFAGVMNAINRNNNPNDATIPQNLMTAKDGGTTITAANIGINADWVSGKVHINTGGPGDNPNTAILYMEEALKSTYPYKSTQLTQILQNAGIDPDLKNNTFSDFMNHVSTVLANDSYSNTLSLKTNVTVLNGIQNSRDSMSGVSLNEEASNMMMFQSAYQASSRLMTALDQVLDVLINSTGTCGR